MDARGQQHPSRYAVAFRVAPGAQAAGALVVDEDWLLLEGRSAEGRVEVSVPYAELVEVRIGRSPEERLNGRPALLLARENGPPIQVEPFGAGFLHELAHLLAALTTEHPANGEQATVILPLKKGCLARAKELVAQGPPFDPAALGLTGHQVFLSADEAIFVFAGPHVRATLERATRDPTLWRVGLAWRGCIGGRPRLAAAAETSPVTGAQPVYSWTASGNRV